MSVESQGWENRKHRISSRKEAIHTMEMNTVRFPSTAHRVSLLGPAERWSEIGAKLMSLASFLRLKTFLVAPSNPELKLTCKGYQPFVLCNSLQESHTSYAIGEKTRCTQARADDN